MRTDELISALAAAGGPVPGASIRRALSISVLVGAGLTFALLQSWLGLRPLDVALATPSFWMKAAYTICLTVSGLVMIWRLARPEGRMGGALAALGLTLAAMMIMGGVNLALTPALTLSEVWLGETWGLCPWRILALSVPVYGVLIVVLRRLAPTRLSVAGAAAGLVAGGVAASLYGLYCQESTAAFVATWYTLGIGISAAMGGLVGARLLRW